MNTTVGIAFFRPANNKVISFDIPLKFVFYTYTVEKSRKLTVLEDLEIIKAKSRTNTGCSLSNEDISSSPIADAYYLHVYTQYRTLSFYRSFTLFDSFTFYLVSFVLIKK